MHHVSTMFLKCVIIGIALVMGAVCAVALPLGIMHDESGGYRWILAGLYIPAVPFFVALYQALRLLAAIDRKQAFSGSSVRALRIIRRCAAAISLLFATGMPYIFTVADRDDAPGVVLIGCIIIGASIVITTFAAVLEKLFQQALDIKSENDLTV